MQNNIKIDMESCFLGKSKKTPYICCTKNIIRATSMCKGTTYFSFTQENHTTFLLPNLK